MEREHLKKFQWKPGQSGNRKGRTRKRILSNGCYKFLLTEIPEVMRWKQPKDPSGHPVGERIEIFPAGTTWGEVCIRALVQQAASGDVKAFKELREAIEGKSAIRLEVFRDFASEDDEVNEDPLAQSLMSLDPVDRSLIIAASNKVFDMITEEASNGASAQGLASDAGREEGAEIAGSSGAGQQNESRGEEDLGYASPS